MAVYDLAPFSNQWLRTLNTLGLSLLILSAHVNRPGSLQVLGPNKRESDIFGLGHEYCQENKTHGPMGGRKTQRHPPQSGPHIAPLRIRALFSAGATSERAQRSLFGLPWALLWIHPPQNYLQILTPRIGLIQKHGLCRCNSVKIQWPYWIRMGPSSIRMKCPYKEEGGLGSRHTGRTAEAQVRPMQLQPRNAEACQQPREAKKKESVLPRVHHGERDPVNTCCGTSASRAGREDIPVD